MAGKNSHWIVATIVAALGYFVDVYDLWLFSIVRTTSLSELGVQGDELVSKGVFLINTQLIGMMIGGIVFGCLGDKRGRLSVLLGSILLYSLATIANAFVTSLDQYAILRLLAGIGLAGEIGGGVTLVSELVPTKYRGYATMFIASIGVSGGIAAGLVGDMLPWRYAYLTGGVAGLSLLLLRVSLKESTLFDSMQNDTVKRGSIKMIFFSRPRLVRYLCCILVGTPIWYAAGVLAGFSPEIAAGLNVQGKVSVGSTLIYMTAGMAATDLISGALSQVMKQRRAPIGIFLVCCAAFSAVLLMQSGISTKMFYILIFMIGGSIGYWAVLLATTAEQFGTNLRATVTTTVPNFIRGSGVILTLLFNTFRPSLGVVGSAQLVGIISIGCALIAIFKLKETFGADLNFYEIHDKDESFQTTELQDAEGF